MIRPATQPPTTPGILRARIAVKRDFLRQCHHDSEEWWRLQRALADLERELYALEAQCRPTGIGGVTF